LLTQATEESERVAREKKNVDPFAFFKRPSASDLAVMTRQLATLVRAGVSFAQQFDRDRSIDHGIAGQIQ
jgi:type II secretory pathway component PulF